MMRSGQMKPMRCYVENSVALEKEEVFGVEQAECHYQSQCTAPEGSRDF